MFSISPAFAETVNIPSGTSVPGCETTNSCWIPSTITVGVGDTVTWYNADTAAHTVTSGPNVPDGIFDSSLFMSGASFSVTFSQAGTYPYFCMVHPWMTGVVNVQGAPSIEYYSLEVSVSPSTVLEDEIAVISGQLYASQYISGYEVSVRSETNTGITSGTWVLDGGVFTENVVYPVGVHTITYYFDSDAGTLVSNTITLTVKTPDLPGTIITLDPFTSSITTDEGKVSFSGQLISENGLAISGKMVIVQAESGGSGQSLSAITDSNGHFTAELDFGVENKVGTWTIYAKFEGGSEYKKSSSSTRQLSVTSAPTPEDDCDPSYPEVCIPVYPPDLDCGEIQYTNFKVLQPDPHGFDGDKDGIGCESTSTPTPPPPAPAGTDVVIRLGSSVPGCEQTKSCYSPIDLYVDVGDTVTWYNADTAEHTVTSGTAAGGPDGVFDSSALLSGVSFSHTFTQSGTYFYFDMIHPWMTGVVTVNEEATGGTDIGIVAWDSSTYQIGNVGKITLVDSDLNVDPNLIQLSHVHLSSDSDLNGVDILVVETGSNTGTFYGDIRFGDITDNTSLKVSPGDNVYVEYDDGTLPSPYSFGDHLTVGDTATISVSTPLTCGPDQVIVGGECVDAFDTSISVFTDRTSYTDGDTIRISGNVGTLIAGTPVSITIIGPTGLVVAIASVDPFSDGSYLATLTAGGTMNVAGEYTINALYGTQSRAAQTTFTFTTSEPIIPPPAPAGTDVEVPLGSSVPGCETTNSCWIPSTISVDVGDTVTWYNADTAAHTVTSGNPTDGPDGVFDSSMLMSGSTFDVTFTQDGTYPYFCMVHPWQVGTVIVSGGGPTLAPTISVSTDRSSYATDDTIIVSGSVNQIIQNVPISLTIINPEGQIVTLDQFTPSSSGTYSVSFNTSGPVWELSGTHTIRVQYGTVGSETTFALTAVPKISASVLVLDPLPTKVNREDFVLMTGRLKTESGIPIAFRTVNLVSDNNGEVAVSTTTDSVGQFAFNWNVKYNYNTYRWYAEFTGDNQFTPSNSVVQSVSVTLRSELYFSPLPNRVDDGTTLTFSGQLTADGLPLAGKTIYIKDDVDFGTDTNLGSVTTDQNGEFSATWDAVPRSSGAYDFYAVFEGDSEAFRVRSATYSVYVTVTQVFEPVRVYTEKTVFSEGDSLLVYGTATPNEELEIALMDSRENIITQKSVRVDSTGLFSMVLFTWQSSSNVNFGEYGVVAWSPIDMRYDGLWVSFIKIEPETFQTKITLNRPQSSVTLNEPITFTGQLQTTDGQPLTFTTVGIATTTNQVPEALQIGTTDSSGIFSITWTSRYTSSSATIPVYAYFGGNQVFDHSISNSYNITIEKPSLSLFTEKTTYRAGEFLVAFGYASPGDTINVSLSAQQGQIMSSSANVASDGSYTVFFDLRGISQGSYTVTAISSSFGTTDSVTIFVEAKVIQETIGIVGDVYFTDQGRKIPLDGIKAVLDIGANRQVDYADSSGRFEFTNIKFDSQVDYLLYFEMTDGKSFNFVDGRQYNSDTAVNRNAEGKVITSKILLLPLDKTKPTNNFSINLDQYLPYGFSDANFINKGFNLQTKIVNFYSKVLGERPPIINVFLFGGDGWWYQSTNWDPNTNRVIEGYWQPRINIQKTSSVYISAFGMEYTHYAQDYAYKKMSGYDTTPREGNHFGFKNPSTADSWVEGVGSFMPAVIAQWENMPESGKFQGLYLEDNRYEPDSIYLINYGSSIWQDEEFSIATLLWDMYDNRNDGEGTSMSIRQVWNLIKGFDSFSRHNPSDYSGSERHIKYFKDFYDYLNENSNIPKSEIDNLFSLHGISSGWSAPGRP